MLWCDGVSVSFAERDPRLVSVTALFVACKVEEWQLNAKLLIKELHRVDSSSSAVPAPAPAPAAPATASATFAYPYSVSDVLAMEFELLHRLTFDLIVFHPYRPLLHFLHAFAALPQYPSLVQHAWWLVNDLYHTDLVLLHPPYLLAAACTYVAAHLLQLDYRPWLKQLSINTAALLDIAQHLLALHDRRERSAEDDRGGAQPQPHAQFAAFTAHDGLHTPVSRAVLDALATLQRHHEGKAARAGSDAASDAVGPSVTEDEKDPLTDDAAPIEPKEDSRDDRDEADEELKKDVEAQDVDNVQARKKQKIDAPL